MLFQLQSKIILSFITSYIFWDKVLKKCFNYWRNNNHINHRILQEFGKREPLRVSNLVWLVSFYSVKNLKNLPRYERFNNLVSKIYTSIPTQILNFRPKLMFKFQFLHMRLNFHLTLLRNFNQEFEIHDRGVESRESFPEKSLTLAVFEKPYPGDYALITAMRGWWSSRTLND